MLQSRGARPGGAPSAVRSGLPSRPRSRANASSMSPATNSRTSGSVQRSKRAGGEGQGRHDSRSGSGVEFWSQPVGHPAQGGQCLRQSTSAGGLDAEELLAAAAALRRRRPQGRDDKSFVFQAF